MYVWKRPQTSSEDIREDECRIEYHPGSDSYIYTRLLHNQVLTSMGTSRSNPEILIVNMMQAFGYRTRHRLFCNQAYLAERKGLLTGRELIIALMRGEVFK